MRANDLRFAPESGSSIRKDSASALPDDVACIADWFIASDVRLAQDVGLSEIAFALRNSRDGFTLWVENGAYRPRPVILLNVRCHADELVAALNKDGGGPTRFLLDLVNQQEIVIHLDRAKMYGGDNLAGDCLIPVDNGCTQRGGLRLEKLHRSLHILSRSGEHSCGGLNQKIGSKGQQHQCEHGLLHGYLPLASASRCEDYRARRPIAAIVQAR